MNTNIYELPLVKSTRAHQQLLEEEEGDVEMHGIEMDDSAQEQHTAQTTRQAAAAATSTRPKTQNQGMAEGNDFKGELHSNFRGLVVFPNAIVLLCWSALVTNFISIIK